ncbi:DsrE family protein [Aequorivita marina]|uniref:DsrE family protein n=1 Tax=Aequorivita marina TaxID=3073654 RepID=UPI0028745978|nr:DsrE family protein [Aequorivita sp. S2608]MDS1299472.1 DsrE family protein [Aequorivita sp. S2608]
MKNTIVTSIFLLFLALSMNAQNWKTPTIEGYGRIVEYEDVAVKPDPTMEYKLLFHITTAKEREGVNVALWKMARTINLLESGGVPKKNIQLVGVISGAATPVTLTEEAHREKMGVSNPNLELLKKLTAYGASIHLCGQAAAKKNIDPNVDMNQYTKLTLSALIDIPTYQMQGYVIMF